MTTVGEILHNARVAKKYTVEQVEQATRIRAKFIIAIEKNDFTIVPPGTFARGFIKNYASFLELPVEETLAFYRRQVNEPKEPAKKPERQEVNLRGFSLTPAIFTRLAVALVLVLFFGYLIFSYINFAGAPQLSVDTPANNTVISKNQVEVKGKTDPEATLTINSEPVNVSLNGAFDVSVSLQPGINTLTVTATNKFKRQSTVIRNVRLEM